MAEKLKSKDFVNLRRRERPSGRVSLYLDICKDGLRTYEYLKLYLVPEKTREDKANNKETLRQAEAIRAQRVVEMRSRQFGVEFKDESKVLFYDYVESLINRKEGSTKKIWRCAMAHLLQYEPNRKITFKEITPKWVRGFRDYLDHKAKLWDIDSRKQACHIEPKPLSEGTKKEIFNKLCCTLNTAVKNEVIDRNPSLNIERFKESESVREFLTIEELRRLTATTPPHKELARAFLFSCLTGLRWSDIIKLKWGEVQRMGETTRLVFTQQKTRGLEYLDLNNQAVNIMGERCKDDDFVFKSDKLANQYHNMYLSRWMKKAGINKHITFHSGRHTFAITMLDAGVDLYTLSKLLGHKNIETTQIYAKILDKNKQAAVNRMPDIFGKS